MGTGKRNKVKWVTSGSHTELTVGGIVAKRDFKICFFERGEKIQTKILNAQEISVMT